MKLSKHNETLNSASESMVTYSKTFLSASKIVVSILTGLVLVGSIVGLGLMTYNYSNKINSISKVGNGKSCLYNQCEDSQLLQCISGICQCNTATSYWNSNVGMCQPLSISSKSHGGFCKAGSTQCQGNTQCINSICQCDTTSYYWTGSACASKLSYNSNCFVRQTITVLPSTDSANCVSDTECNQCLSSSLLSCNVTLGRCTCTNSLYYYDSSLGKCTPLLSYYSACSYSSQCDYTIGLYCQNISSSLASNCPTVSALNKCDCANNQYYDMYYAKCLSKKGYSRPCTYSCECDSANKGLSCNGGICSCPKLTYYNSIALACTTAKTGSYNSSCKANSDCNTDIGLICSVSSVCDCVLSTNYYWSSSVKMCVACPDGWIILKAANNISRCYYFSPVSYIWINALQNCPYDNALLVSFKDVYEFNVVYSYLWTYAPSQYFHIGINATNTYYYYWVDNTYIGYGGSIGCNILNNATLFYTSSYGFCAQGSGYSQSYGSLYVSSPPSLYMYYAWAISARYICKKNV